MPVSKTAAPSGSFNLFGRLATAYPEALGKVVRAAAFNINTRVQASFREPKTGRFYGDHRASAPGEAPAIDIGTLASSYQVMHVGPTTSVVASNDEKAPYMEFGTRDIEPRPHLGPAAEAEREPFKRAAQRALESVR